ncbi:DUF3509 domain-containing protein, partial [Pseudomonas aeruginosa]|uniref:DUF3509 domain-containing protein n=1 Tax=Pseudomonas aeruginosa TaxID=287 RepID=UPI00396976AB
MHDGDLAPRGWFSLRPQRDTLVDPQGETLLQRVIAKVQLNDESYLEDAVQTIRRELQVLVGRMEEDVLATFRERDHVLLYSSR